MIHQHYLSENSKKKKTFDELIKENYLTEAQRKYLVDRWRSGKAF